MTSNVTKEWLNQYQLIDASNQYCDVFKRVYSECLNVTDEKVLIICDEGYENSRLSALMATSYLVAAERMNLDANIVIQKPKKKGEMAEQQVIDSLSELKEGSIVVMCLSHRLGSIKDISKSYRKYIQVGNHRFVSTPSLNNLSNEQFPVLVNSVNIDYKSLQHRCVRIKEVLDSAKELHITSPGGTDFWMSIRGKEALMNDGDYKLPATGGNIPAGEIYLPPYGKKKVNGTIVVDSTISFRGGSLKVKDPMKIIVEQGKAVEIQGGDEARILENTLTWAEERACHPWGIRRVCEFGIGLNPNARITGATIIDEKVIGTAHFALGSNYWFGGTIYAITHLDQVFKNPTIYADGKKIDI